MSVVRANDPRSVVASRFARRLAGIVGVVTVAVLALTLLDAGIKNEPSPDEARLANAANQAEFVEQFLRAEYPNEVVERAQISQMVTTFIAMRDFVSLQRLGSVYRNERQRTHSGLWKLSIFYDAFRLGAPAAADDDKAWSGILTMMKEWQEAYPKSAIAVIGTAVLLEQRGWSYTRGGLIPDADELARKHFEAARRLLVANESVAAGDPQYFVVLADIAIIQGVDSASFLEIVQHGWALEPEYYQLYFSALRYFSPQWYGDAKQIEAFANMAVSQTRDREGEGMYARIYWSAAQTVFGIDLFQESWINWPRMKQGIQDVLSRYPDAWNRNHFALFACIAGDTDTTRSLMAQIGDHPLPQAWNPVPGSFRRCKAWSMEPPEPVPAPGPAL